MQVTIFSQKKKNLQYKISLKIHTKTKQKAFLRKVHITYIVYFSEISSIIIISISD